MFLTAATDITGSTSTVDPRTFVYEGQEIKICCKPCEKKFLKDPAKYLEKLAPKKS